MMQKQRLSRELQKMSNSPPEGICVFAKDDDMHHLEAKVTGPIDSPYENGVFSLNIIVPEKYPFAPPSITFSTKIYHPNIDENGRICLDLIKMPPAGSWKPTIGLEGLLTAIRMLLQYPNPDDPLMADIAEEFKNNKQEFLKKAKSMTDLYAK